MVAKAATREPPIIFGGEMVKAILENRKSQTRRVMKGQPPDDDFDVGFYHPTMIARNGEEYPGDEIYGAFSKDGEWGIKSRFAPGMILWVREKFSYQHGCGKDDGGYVWYWADGQCEYGDWTRPKPSIFMPRWASRITLEVTDVRMEQVQSISEEDARAEGVPSNYVQNLEGFDPERDGYLCREGLKNSEEHPGDDWSGGGYYRTGREAFESLWNSINGTRNGGKYSWEANPMVEAVTFKRIDNGR